MILKSSSVVKLWLNDIERGDEKNTFELEDIKDYNNLRLRSIISLTNT